MKSSTPSISKQSLALSTTTSNSLGQSSIMSIVHPITQVFRAKAVLDPQTSLASSNVLPHLSTHADELLLRLDHPSDRLTEASDHVFVSRYIPEHEMHDPSASEGVKAPETGYVPTSSLTPVRSFSTNDVWLVPILTTRRRNHWEKRKHCTTSLLMLQRTHRNSSLWKIKNYIITHP